MATVVVTFFLLTRFYVCKMDAEFIDGPRSGELSRREKRWSMNSQRLEEIVAELMKPISDVRRSFDTDLCALLEEYLTEAGLHALEAGEADGADDESGRSLAAAAPNYAELALLLQHSASVYGRKVDFLYQHVLSVSDSLHNNSQELELAGTQAGEEEEAGGGRRRRRAWAGGGGGGGGFEAVGLDVSAAAAREAGRARPPPTLPRAYIELEPRALSAADRPLTDYEGEPIGLLADFHVAWRLQGGLLVDELEVGAGAGAGGTLRPPALMELQAALQAAAPPALVALAAHDTHDEHDERDDSPPRTLSPLHASTPLPLLALPPLKRERKRKNATSIDDLIGSCFKILISKEVRRQLSRRQEFSVSEGWASGVVTSRKAHILRSRRRLRAATPQLDFHGFENSCKDLGGFAGWSSSEVAAAKATAAATATSAAIVAATTTTTPITTTTDGDSDDDGFFEQSSLGESDGSRVEDSALPTPAASLPNSAGAADEWWSWQAGVLAAAAAREARPPDVRALAAALLAALPPPPAAVPARPLLAAAHAGQPADLPGLFLATLFLANAGNVEIIQGPPLSLNSFSVRFVTDDARRYCAAADAEFLR